MNLGVGRVVELLRHPRVRRLFHELLGARDGAFHALGAGREHELRAEHREQRAPLERHRLGHREDELVAFGRRDERQRDAGVAARRLDDHGVLVRARPRFSASSIIAMPIRSFTLPSGLKNSHLSAMVVLGSTPGGRECG